MVAQDARQQIDVGEVGDVLERQPVGVSRLAIISGSAAFLAPEIGIVPLSRLPPTILMRSMGQPRVLSV